MRFGIVTPSRDSAPFLREAIGSVLSQEGDFEIDYLVVDGGSTDGTLDILREYAGEGGGRPLLREGVSFRWISEADDGMYDAIRKGFGAVSGDLLAWINADDVYRPGAFAAVARAAAAFPGIDWIKGVTDYIDAESRPLRQGRCLPYRQAWIRDGIYGREARFIQQDSVFFRPALLAKAGDAYARLALAGDYALWTAFARHAPLHSLDARVSCFRTVPGQKSEAREAYARECEAARPPGGLLRRRVGWYHRNRGRIPAPLRPLLYRLLCGSGGGWVVSLPEGGEPVLRLVECGEADG